MSLHQVRHSPDPFKTKAMLQNYLKVALRNLWRYKGNTLINILGLSIGMACVILIMLYVGSELSYDRYHGKADQIYRLNIQSTNPQTGETNERWVGPYRMADELAVDFSDFANLVRIGIPGRELITYQEKQYTENRLSFVDPEIFQVFDFPLVHGDPREALEDPFSVVISESTAKKYFGDANPLGEVLNFRDQDFEVKGVMEDIPENSQFQFDIMASINCGPQIFSRIILENWGEGFGATFVELPEGTSPANYEDRLAAFVSTKLEAWSAFSPKISMQPLPELYLYSQDIGNFIPSGDITYVYAFSFIALFILIIACINFMNLATARSTLRAREVGLRKVVGARRGQLIWQFLSESILLSLLSLLLALFIANRLLPFFNQLAGKDMELQIFSNPSLIVTLLAVALVVGILSGGYPALLLSGFKPVTVLSGKLASGIKGSTLRKVLVTFQFASSILLLIVTAVVNKQLDYCYNMDLGFDKEHLVLINGTPIDFRDQYDQFRSELLSNPNIVNGAASSRVPPGNLSSSLRARPEGVPEDEQRGMQTVWTDFDFIETMGFEMAAGRSFSREFPADAQTGFILNEAAVKEIGWTNEDAIDKTFGSSEIKDWNAGQWLQRDGKVIGVLKDFHFESLKQEIIPTVYFIAPYMAWNYVVRINGDDIPKTIGFIEEKWNQFNPEVPFQYAFVDENFGQLYAAEQRQSKIFTAFSVLAILIACLGLVGLSSFTAERKRKEVGIRKVLGASSLNLVVLLTKEFTLLVLIAFAVAAPVAWFIMNNWLQDFVYRVPLGIMVFLIAGGIALGIAWITVAYQTAKTAFSNPIKALRYE